MANKGKAIGGIAGLIILLAGIYILTYEPSGLFGALGKALIMPMGITFIIFSPVYPAIGYLLDKKTELEESL